jgi:protein tyrosine/serine phosphatase
MPVPKPFDLLRRLAVICGCVVLGLVLLPVSFYGFLHLDHNSHEVVPGRLYRSAQLPPEKFVSLARRVGLRTVINLRGENAGCEWYDEQFRSAQAMGIGFINYRMSASRELTPEQMAELARILRDAPKPILVHCGSGSDRTGLACALYLFGAGHSSSSAAQQLSLRFGHFPYLWCGSWAMDASLRSYSEHVRTSQGALVTGAN